MNFFKVTRALPGDSLSAQIEAGNTAASGDIVAVRGQIVQIDAASIDPAVQSGVFDDRTKWKLANGTRGFHLERDVIVGPLPIESIVFNQAFLHPDLCNPDTKVGYASARKVQEFEIEGADLIDSSLDENTAIGTALSSKSGKLSLKGTGDELYGYLRAQLMPEDPDNNDFRFLVEVVE
jgi:hypothetical protein